MAPGDWYARNVSALCLVFRLSCANEQYSEEQPACPIGDGYCAPPSHMNAMLLRLYPDISVVPMNE